LTTGGNDLQLLAMLEFNDRSSDSDLSKEGTPKRRPGQLNGKFWQVTLESTRRGRNYVHNCGEELSSVTLTVSVPRGYTGPYGSGVGYPEDVPFCPNCEREPQRIEFDSNGGLVVY
jgi:hypothetical protein